MLKELRFSEIDLQTRFLILFSALLPFEMDMMPIMVIWTGFWFFTGEYQKFRWQLMGQWSFVLLLFFGLHVAGFLHTENLRQGWMDVRAKSSFLFLPVLLSTYRLTEQRKNAILFAFVTSCLCISSLLLFRNLLYMAFTWSPPLTYRHYCLLVHPSYFALYQCWAIVIFYCSPVKIGRFDLKKAPLRYIVPVIFILSILFASSKTGLIALLLSTFVLLAWYFFMQRSKIRRIAVYAAIGVTLAGIFTSVVTSSPLNRLVTATKTLLHPRHIDKTARESTAMRLLIWTSSIEIIKENFVFGVGTGDINSELQKSYQEHQFAYPLLYKLNSHSQFLESQIMLGIFGSLCLLYLVFAPFFNSLFRKQVLLLILTCIIIVNFSVESMLYQPTACVFFSFFLILLLKRADSSSRDQTGDEPRQTKSRSENLTVFVRY